MFAMHPISSHLFAKTKLSLSDHKMRLNAFEPLEFTHHVASAGRVVLTRGVALVLNTPG
jgi:hypothetical protein